MILSKENLNAVQAENLQLPQSNIFSLPEKVLQFGTGVLLRGLPDYFIDKANRQGVFNGRIAVVKSTAGPTAEFDAQDCLYTLCVRGIENGKEVSENIISSAISRVISAHEDWAAILQIAQSPDLKVVISNTTELGIQLVEESIHQNPPASFPAKLLAILYQRFQTFNGSAESGLVMVPTELITANGSQLARIVLELAKYNHLGDEFINWLQHANTFCNSLVDRIVPGKPDANTLAQLEKELGYTDHLLSTTEPYRLWAIEGNEDVAKVLDFAGVDTGVIITSDIEIYKELKVRLLNGTHTLSSGIAFLSGIDTVKDAMKNEQVSNYVGALMSAEIGPAIPYAVTEKQTTEFANAVKDRFANPSIEHLWINITFQYSLKLKVRVLPVLLNFYKIYKQVPEHIALGFAAYLLFMKTDKLEDGKYYGTLNGKPYPINDERADYFYQQIQAHGEAYAINILHDADFWETDLNQLPGFVAAVEEKYRAITQNGMADVLAKLSSTHLSVS